jgi:crotonobetainyl-CoA:carnitine CoA-transferase CaiB-like acyl-CoA transferase
MTAAGPLDGVRVVDLTAVFLGPLASQTLGDLGADVVKVETPDGDITRSIAPARNPGMGAGFLAVNRNKRSVVLDLKQAAGRAALGRLVAGADVLMHSMRPQAMDRLGFGPDAARAVNPRIIHCAAYGYRRDGPHGWRPAYDDVIQGASGLAALQASFAGEPRYVPTSMVDKLVGLTVASAINAALYHRERSGEGQAIEIPMYETMVAFLFPEHMAGRSFRPPLGPAGYGRVLAPYRRPYRTADGHIGVLPYTVQQWQRLFRLIDRPEMADDPRVTDGATRSRHVGELYGMVADVPARRPTGRRSTRPTSRPCRCRTSTPCSTARTWRRPASSRRTPTRPRATSCSSAIRCAMNARPPPSGACRPASASTRPKSWRRRATTRARSQPWSPPVSRSPRAPPPNVPPTPTVANRGGNP